MQDIGNIELPLSIKSIASPAPYVISVRLIAGVQITLSLSFWWDPPPAPPQTRARVCVYAGKQVVPYRRPHSSSSW